MSIMTMGNVIRTISSTGFDYWAAYVYGEKIKTDGLKLHTGSDDITHLWHTLELIDLLWNPYIRIFNINRYIYC